MRLDPQRQPWMTAPSTRAVMQALDCGAGRARFVGGAVRNSLLGESVGDVDIATQFTPPEVLERLSTAGIRAIGTGIEHGTVTAVCEAKPFEITSLRRDVETFGRRAVVAFTTEWEEDAQRRDFTINALYASEDGALFDYFGGLDDIVARRVRFIGDARQRIREDYLRILRFFRFHAWYGRGEPDFEGISACTDERSGLKLLSGERVQKELMLLLAAQDPTPVIALMRRHGILGEILNFELRVAPLGAVIAIQLAQASQPWIPLRLAAMLDPSEKVARDVAQKLRFSNEDRDRFVAALARDSRISADLSAREARRLIYRAGRICFSDQLVLQWASSGNSPDDSRWRALLAVVDEWKNPEYPLTGVDVMALGVPEGPRIGVLLREAEEWWVEHDFAPSRDELLERLRKTINL